MGRNYDAVTDPSTYENTDFGGWSKEAYDIGITLYDGINQNEALPQSYIDANWVMTENRVMLGGYRLAYIIEYMFPSSSTIME